jgi:hypothetical protein
MLPIFHQSDGPPRPEETPEQPLPLVLLVFYCVAGAASCAVGVCVAWGTTYAFDLWIDRMNPKPSVRGDGFIERQPPDPRDVAERAAAALGPGAGLGLILGLIASAWRALRHPVRAASLCASVAGTAFLIFLVLETNQGHLRILVLTATIFLVGAVFGFLTTWLARVMEHMLEKLVRH